MSKPPRLGRRIGVIDIGSNSVRFVVYHIFGAAFFPTYNEKVLAGLGRDLRETGRLSEDGKRETLEALKRFAHIIRARDLSPILMGATAAMRDAEDGPEFCRDVKEQTGIDIIPVSGEEEARLAAQGVLAGDRRATGLACDLGGASLEIVPIADGAPSKGVSLRLGPFQVVGDDLREDFDPDIHREDVRTLLAEAPEQSEETLYLVGGAWRNLGLIHQERVNYPMRVLQAYELSAEEALEYCRWAYGPGRHEVETWRGVSERRRETLPYGALVLEELIGRYGPKRIRISATGLREGMVADYLGELRRKRMPLVDGCRDLARGNLQAEGMARPLGAFLEPIEAHLPRSFEPENEARLRLAARHLAGMGRGLHPDYRADLVFENVLYAPLSGLLHEERAFLAHVLYSSYTSSRRTVNEGAMRGLLSPEQRQAAQIYGAAMRLGEAASGRAVSLLSQMKLSWEDGEVKLSAQPGYEDLVSGRIGKRVARLNFFLSAEATFSHLGERDESE